MMRLFCNVLLVLALGSCTSKSNHTETSVKQEIDSLMHLQELAWSNGDVEGFMEYYWKSDSLVFSSTKNRTFGWRQAVDRYKKGYPNTKAMGTLKFSESNTDLIADNVAFTTGKWTLHREQDTLSGRFTLVWKWIDGEWCIIADHSS